MNVLKRWTDDDMAIWFGIVTLMAGQVAIISKTGPYSYKSPEVTFWGVLCLVLVVVLAINLARHYDLVSFDEGPS